MSLGEAERFIQSQASNITLCEDCGATLERRELEDTWTPYCPQCAAEKPEMKKKFAEDHGIEG